MPAAFIATESSYQRGDYFPFHLKNQDRLYVGTVWTITAPDGTVTPIPQSTVGFTFTQSGQYKIEAAVAPSVGADVVETLVTYVTVH